MKVWITENTIPVFLNNALSPRFLVVASYYLLLFSNFFFCSLSFLFYFVSFISSILCCLLPFFPLQRVCVVRYLFSTSIVSVLSCAFFFIANYVCCLPSFCIFFVVWRQFSVHILCAVRCQFSITNFVCCLTSLFMFVTLMLVFWSLSDVSPQGLLLSAPLGHFGLCLTFLIVSVCLGW